MAQKRAAEEGVEEIESGEARTYELGFHLDPALPAEEVKKAYNEIRTEIAKHGELIAEGEPKNMTLAYTISRQETGGRRDFDSAYFSWIAYEVPIEAHEEIIKGMNAKKYVVRFIDLTTYKEAVRAAAEREALEEKVPEASPAPSTSTPAEPVSEDAALDAALESATT